MLYLDLHCKKFGCISCVQGDLEALGSLPVLYSLPFTIMLRLHWTTFSLRPYHVLKIQERGEDGVKMKQFRISKFPLRPYYVPATFLLRPHHVLTTSFTFPLRPQYALTKFMSFPLRPCYVLTKTKQFIPRANYVSSTF